MVWAGVAKMVSQGLQALPPGALVGALIGGAIGIALIDTVLFTRTPEYADSLLEGLKAGDPEAARITGISIQDSNFEDPVSLMTIMGDIEVAALTLAANDAWMLLAIISVAAIAALFLSPRKSP
jgi:DHA2 family multidrug resistance protein